MLEIRNLAVQLARAGTVLDGLSLTCSPGEIWGIVGQTGSGATTLLSAIAGALPPGAHLGGRVLWRGQPLAPGHSSVLRLAELPPMPVAEYVRALTDDMRAEAEGLGLGGHLSHRTGTLPPDLQVALRLAALRHSPPAKLVLIDGCLTAAAGSIREQVAEEVARRAAAGAVVLWADHDLDTVYPAASHILELDRGREVFYGPQEEWEPRTLPNPTVRLLRRMLGLQSDEQPDDLVAAAARLTRRPAAVPFRAASNVLVEAETVGLAGPPVEIGSDEAVGLVDLSQRPEPLARRIITALGGDVVSSHLRPGNPHSSGEAARLRAEQSGSCTSALWLPHPQAGLDPRDRATLAARLAGSNAGPRLVTTRDVEFLVRACRRVIVVRDGQILATGSPHAVAHHLPEQPIVSRTLGTHRFLRLSDILLEEEP